MTTGKDASISRHGDIIIVRRRHEEDEGHHGGVWKIAFADFMTALMAFFLVMWLVNASDDATKRQVAQYFNPIKLNAASPPSPDLGVNEQRPVMRETESEGGVVGAAPAAEGKPVGGTKEGGEDQALFRDPYAVLAEIVADGGPATATGRSDVVLDGSGLPGLNGGDAFRDPFDPTSWQLAPNAVERAQATEEPLNRTNFVTRVVEAAPEAGAASGEEGTSAPPEPAQTPAGTPDVVAAVSEEDAEADAIEEELRDSAENLAPGASDGVEVSAAENGIVISLGDSLTNGMFEIGSARPRAETIRLVEQVAKILSEREGTIVIRGHTDSRPYAGEDYDNWRLSTARAHMAYYMLLRGGLDEARVSAIEGMADRRPKLPDDPEAAANRRIEILLIEPTA